jgi:Kef-type K+ transport system membrane component KefB
MMRSFALVAAAMTIIYSARSFVRSGELATGSGAALAFGFLLIAAIQMGEVAHKLRIPHLTGFLLCGLLFGPEVLSLVSKQMIGELAIVKGTAVGLIALLAGSELNFRAFASRVPAILWTTIFSVSLAGILLFALFYFVTGVLPATAAFSTTERVVVAILGANVLCAFSPAVVIGVISETRARGPLSELCMSIVVVADLIIVLTFSLSSALARATFPEVAASPIFSTLAMHLLGSATAGLLFGATLALYVRRVHARTGLLVFAVLFVIAEAGRAIHLDPLLVGLTAGLFLANLAPRESHEVVESMQPVAVPTFAIFFAVIGAEVHLRAFLHVAPFAVAAAIIRAAGIFAGARFGAGWSKRVSNEVARLVPFGLLPQAGVAIALAILVLNGFPPWGGVIGTILLGSIVVNELLGPVLFRLALVRAGEVSDIVSEEGGTQTA